MKALDLDAQRPALSVRLSWGTFASRSFVGILGAFLLLIGVPSAALVSKGAEMLVVLSTVSLCVALLTWIARQTVDVLVGSDGVFARRWPTKRFISYRDIASVERDDRVLRLELRSGESLILARRATGLGQESSEEAEKSREDLVARVQTRMQEYVVGPARVATAAQFARAGRTVEDWVRALRALGSGAATSDRVAAIPVDELWRIVEDSAIRGDVRAGAAIALQSSFDDRARMRLRRIAEAAASPKVRVALEATATQGADERIVEALTDLQGDDEAEARQARRSLE